MCYITHTVASECGYLLHHGISVTGLRRLPNIKGEPVWTPFFGRHEHKVITALSTPAAETKLRNNITRDMCVQVAVSHTHAQRMTMPDLPMFVWHRAIPP